MSNRSRARAIFRGKATARQPQKVFGAGGKETTLLPLVHPKLFPLVEFCVYAFGFGGKGIRTPDFQLAKLALYQLSYAPAQKVYS